MIGLAIALGAVVLVGWAPDGGSTDVSLGQAVALGVVFAAVPVAVWLAPSDPQNLVAVGGGLAVTGAATMLGGNVLLGAAIPYGFLILWLGARQRPPMTPRLAARLLVTAVALMVAVGCAILPGVLTSLGAFVLATVVAGSSVLGSARSIQAA